mgnify:FL=1
MLYSVILIVAQRSPVIGTLAIAYLFCGGTGAGTVLMACVLDARFSQTGNDSNALAVSRAFCAGFALLLFGSLCLLFDVGRIDRVEHLLFTPSFSIISVGFFALAALLVLSALISAARILQTPPVHPHIARIAHVLAALLSITVMAYTGILLCSIRAVALWNTFFLPALFLFSSVSTGCAVTILSCCSAGSDGALIESILRIDGPIVVLEAICAAGFAIASLASEHVGAAISRNLLFAGGDPTLTVLWWVGFAICGIAAPLSMYARAIIPARRQRMITRASLAYTALAVLFAAACLRYCVVSAGTHAPMKLDNPLQAAIPAAVCQESEPK